MEKTLDGRLFYEFAEDVFDLGGGSEAGLIVFVCKDNTVFSPMAEAIARHLLQSAAACDSLWQEGRSAFDTNSLRQGGAYAVASAARCGSFGRPIDRRAANALLRGGIRSDGNNDYLSHTSRQVDCFILASAKWVVAACDGDMMGLISEYPEFASKMLCVGLDCKACEGIAANTLENEENSTRVDKIVGGGGEKGSDDTASADEFARSGAKNTLPHDGGENVGCEGADGISDAYLDECFRILKEYIRGLLFSI